MILAADGVSEISWLRNGFEIALLASVNGKKALTLVNVKTGSVEPLFNEADDITSYAFDAKGDTVVYAVPDGSQQSDSGTRNSSQMRGEGYLITNDQRIVFPTSDKMLYVRHRDESRKWSNRQQIILEDPFSHKKLNELTALDYLSISPDGRRLLLNYNRVDIPQEWKNDPIVKNSGGIWIAIMVMYDLHASKTTLALNSVWPGSLPMWSADGTSFLVNAHPPIGSLLEARDIRDHRSSGADSDLLLVNADSGNVQEVLQNVPEHHEGPLFWNSVGDITVRAVGRTIVTLRQSGGDWKRIAELKLPANNDDYLQDLASNGKVIVGVRETIDTPEEIFEYEPGQSDLASITNLNPQLSDVQFNHSETVHWSTKDGMNVDGLLFYPRNYVPGIRYPMVIQTKGEAGWFTCDSGSNHDPAFAPQPIASAGLFYLIRRVEEHRNIQDEEAQRPKGYPGNLSEAVQQMDIWDGAVESLVNKGIVDPSKVGIIGFSRAGWQVEFDLVHAKTHYAAATAADNIQYSLGEYWLMPWVTRDFEAMYGGPPFGQTLENWKRFSISFSFEKVRTPLLMEIMGYGTKSDPYSIPLTLAAGFEVFSSLSSLQKPVELYFYPNEQHQPDSPRARLASLQRNVDWYRFWLQGYERPNQEDPDQYKRWEHLRELRDAHAKTTEQAQDDNASKPN